MLFAGSGDVDEGLSVSADLVAGVRAGVLPRRRAGEAQIRQDRLEHLVRLQRVRFQRLLRGAQDLSQQGLRQQ